MKTRKTVNQKKVCPNGHTFFKTSDCPVCPFCEQQRKPVNGFLSLLSAPARRALENKNINTLKKLSQYQQKEIMQLHGMGPSSQLKLQAALKAAGLSFRNEMKEKKRD